MQIRVCNEFRHYVRSGQGAIICRNRKMNSEKRVTNSGTSHPSILLGSQKDDNISYGLRLSNITSTIEMLPLDKLIQFSIFTDVICHRCFEICWFHQQRME